MAPDVRNMEDPTVQEKIRRGSHEYAPELGKHGSYKTKPYFHQEYPKMMLKTPAPQFKDFRNKPDGQILFDAAVSEWNQQCQASIVNNKDEEELWLVNEKKLEAAFKKDEQARIDADVKRRAENRDLMLEGFRQVIEELGLDTTKAKKGRQTANS